MGVVNVTPDSFSDGGAFADPEAAIAQGARLAAEGADLLDVGGESTRPGAIPVPAAVEMERVLPVIRGLRAKTDAPISIDTYKAEVARAAVRAGAELVNDISGLRFDPEMAPTVARLGVPLLLTHSRGRGPEDLHREPRYEDVAREVADELALGLDSAVRAGIPREQILLDPGIGFSKSAEHNLPLLEDLGPILALGRPVLVGVSRKSFLGRITGRPAGERLTATLAATVAAVLAGAHVVRTHDVAPLGDALRVADAIRRGRLPEV
jgi:dihydropteroate synthase